MRKLCKIESHILFSYQYNNFPLPKRTKYNLESARSIIDRRRTDRTTGTAG